MSPNELSALTPIAKTLNEKSNEINENIALVNSKLAALNVGVEVWHGPWEQDPEPYQIGYAKVGDKWELATRTCKGKAQISFYGGHDEYVAVAGSSGLAKSLLQAPRSVRIETLGMLPEIIESLKDEMEQTIEVLEKAKTVVSAL